VFEDELEVTGKAISSYLSGITIKLAYPIAARLNHTVRNGKLSSVKDELEFWFGSQSKMVGIFDDRIKTAYPSEEYNGLRILNIWSNLRLLEYILENPEDVENELDNNIIYDKLIKAYLLINQMYLANLNTKNILDSIPNERGIVFKSALTFAAMSLPYHDLNHVDPLDAFIVHTIKAIYFFKFMEENLSELLNKFLQTYEVNDWKMYLRALLPIAHHALRRNTEGLSYLNLDASMKESEVQKRFLNLLSSGSTKIPEKDFVNLRSRPLLSLSETRFLVIDNLLVFNKIYNSLYFEFNELVQSNPIILGKTNFKSYLNSHFSEDYLAKSILGVLFENELKISGSEIKSRYKNKIKSEPDYYAKKHNGVFLFELKDTFIKGETKQGFDPLEILKELQTKFWYTESEKNGKLKISHKAILQLIGNIVKIIENDFLFDSNVAADPLYIFPIILYVDQSLSTIGINDIICQWFSEEVLKSAAIMNRRQNIQILPVTMIDLDTLILFQDEFRDSRRDLGADIINYWNQKNELIKRGLQLKTNIISNGLLPFGQFIRLNRNNRTPPIIFEELAKAIFSKDQSIMD
jgi:hypothetical protein